MISDELFYKINGNVERYTRMLTKELRDVCGGIESNVYTMSKDVDSNIREARLETTFATEGGSKMGLLLYFSMRRDI